MKNNILYKTLLHSFSIALPVYGLVYLVIPFIIGLLNGVDTWGNVLYSGGSASFIVLYFGLIGLIQTAVLGRGITKEKFDITATFFFLAFCVRVLVFFFAIKLLFTNVDPHFLLLIDALLYPIYSYFIYNYLDIPKTHNTSALDNKLGKQPKTETELEKAFTSCENEISNLSHKVNLIERKIEETHNADFLEPEEIKQLTQQLAQVKNTYTKQIDGYYEILLRLKLSKPKEMLNKLINSISVNGEEIDGDELERIEILLNKNLFNGVVDEKFGGYNNSQIDAIRAIIAQLKHLDKREEFMKGVEEFSVGEFVNTNSTELQKQLELADMQNTDLISDTLNELKEQNAAYKNQIARLKAENDVMNQFGE